MQNINSKITHNNWTVQAAWPRSNYFLFGKAGWGKFCEHFSPRSSSSMVGWPTTINQLSIFSYRLLVTSVTSSHVCKFSSSRRLLAVSVNGVKLSFTNCREFFSFLNKALILPSVVTAVWRSPPKSLRDLSKLLFGLRSILVNLWSSFNVSVMLMLTLKPSSMASNCILQQNRTNKEII